MLIKKLAYQLRQEAAEPGLKWMRKETKGKGRKKRRFAVTTIGNTTISNMNIPNMTTHTWKQLYELAYDSEKADFGSQGREAAVKLRELALQAEYNPQLHTLAHSPLERAFFMLGESQTPSPSRFRVTLGPLAGVLYLLS